MRRALLLPLLVLLVLLLPEPATAAPSSSRPPAYAWPLPGPPVVDRGFEPPRTTWGAGHRGVDLRAALGTPVLAAGAGRVTYAGLLAGRGVVVVAHPGGLRTTYEPVTATVHVDEVVTRGALLGLLAEGHASCRAGVTCLHWGLLRGDTYLDPRSLLGGRDVRLLPLHHPSAAPVAGDPPVGDRPPDARAAASPPSGTAAARRDRPAAGRAAAATALALAGVGAWALRRGSG